MREKIRTVELKPINPDTLKISKVPDSPDSFSVELPVTEFCDESWKMFFSEKVRTTTTALNRRLNIQISWLSIAVVTASEDIKDTVALVKKLVLATNEEVKKYNEEVEKEWEAYRKEEKIVEEKISKMREALKQV